MLCTGLGDNDGLETGEGLRLGVGLLRSVALPPPSSRELEDDELSL